MDKSVTLAAAEWATFLMEHGVYAIDAQAAVDHRMADALLNDNPIVFNHTGDCLWGAFVWQDAPEGHSYWYAVSNAFEAKYNELSS